MAGAIEVKDPTDDDFQVAADIATACLATWAPDEPAMPAAELAAWYRTAPAVEPELLFLAGDDGYAIVDLPSGGSNEHLGTSWELGVRPGARRQGVGRALVDAVRESLQASGRNLFITVSRVGDEGSAAFARSTGARADLVEHGNRCATADLDRSMLTSWVADATTSAPGYSLVAFEGPVPDDLLHDLAAVALAMNDAPHSEGMEPSALSPEVERQQQDRWGAIGLRVLTACARHDETGELAGYTQLLVNPFRPWLTFQENTGVLPSHRGKRIGRWIKAANALRLLEEHSEVTTIETGNAASNAPMLAINHAMGFRKWVAWQAWELDL